MNDQFVDWYRLVSIEPTSEQLERRWKALARFDEKIDQTNVLDIVRLFYGLQVQKGVRENYVAAFKAEDATFSARDNDLEIQVLAGASLMHLFSENEGSLVKDIASLAILTAAFHGTSYKAVNPDVITEARSYIATEAVRVRDYSKPATTPFPIADLEKLVADFKTAAAANTVNAINEPLVNALTSLAKSTEVIANDVASAFKNVSAGLESQREETDVLWWLFGEFSEEFDCPFVSVSKHAAPIIYAKELADLTKHNPSLYSAEAFITKALRLTEIVIDQRNPISEVINDIPSKWRSSLIEDSRLPSVVDLCPLHFAISKAEETGDPAAWRPLFDKALGWKNKVELTPVQFGLQFYYERMLLNCLGS